MPFFDSFFEFVGGSDFEASSYLTGSGLDVDEALDNLAEQFLTDDEGVNRVFDRLEHDASQRPYEVLARATALVGVINSVQKKAKRLTTRLSNAIQRMKSVLQQIKTTTGATSFTITIGFPVAVSIAVTF